MNRKRQNARRVKVVARPTAVPVKLNMLILEEEIPEVIFESFSALPKFMALK